MMRTCGVLSDIIQSQGRLNSVALGGLLWLLVLLLALPTMAAEPLDWVHLPPLPDETGVAGPFAGTHNHVLLVGGGANFPDGMPWDGGEKRWHDAVYVLEPGAEAWQTGFKLPRPLAYGVSLSLDAGVVCIGGDDADTFHDDVFLLRYEEGTVTTTLLPSLPHPLAYSAGAVLDGRVYVAGGLRAPESEATEALDVFWMLDLTTSEPQWEALPTWPGPERFLAFAAALDGSVFVGGGVQLSETADARRTYLRDVYRYTPGAGWRQVADMPRPAAAAPTPAPTVGDAHFLVLGGDDGGLLGFQPPADHPGFTREILAYHVTTDAWLTAGALPFETKVTVPAVYWQDAWTVPSGEVRPGVRDASVWAAHFSPLWRRARFGVLNWTVLSLYLGAMVVMAMFFAGRQRDTREFFLGSRSMPWWAVGLSIFATQLSAITFIAIPARSYGADWTYFLANMSIPLAAPFVIYCFLPYFRRQPIASAYEYLEQRFNVAVSFAGSAAYVLLQLGRIGVVLFIPSLTLATVTGMDVRVAIVLMSLLATAYTVLGGIRAVIWTDVIQAVVLIGGAVLCFIILLAGIPDGFAGLLRIGAEQDKFTTFLWDWDATLPVVWVVVLGNFTAQFVPYAADQTVVQRYLTTATTRQAAKSIWTNALLCIPISFLFFGVGTALYVYYRTHPDPQLIGLRNDAVFPLFIAGTLPPGIAGGVIAGVFAATMSSVDSAMNSIATVVTSDYRRLCSIPEERALRMARGLTAFLGLFAAASALLIASADVRYLWDQYVQLLGLFGGSLAGMFCLGIFTRRANSIGALVGGAASAVILFLVSAYTPLHFFLYSGIGIGSCIVVGYVASLPFPARK